MSKYAVVKTYSYDPDTEVITFPNEEKAHEYIRQEYKKAIEEEKHNDPDSTGFSEEDCWIAEDGSWASIIWCNIYEDNSDSMNWRVTEIKHKGMRTFNVQYLDPGNKEDETQFDIEDADFVNMFNELAGLFGGFCSEHYKDDPCWIMSIEEVPYDGEEE